MIKHIMFQRALPILKKIEDSGFEAYFVGGCVRDVILGKPISDVDIATSAYPEEIKRIFPKTIDVGIEHGTVMILYQNDSYEITTFRVESTYQDFRRPDEVTFVRDLSEDLKRRDFTINALAMDIRGHIYDFHYGQDDMAKKVVRAVGNPSERFHEDALRMMRGIRFVAQLDFMMDNDTFSGIQTNASLLQHIAIERIRVEFEKIMIAKAKQKGIDLLIESGLYQFCPNMANQIDNLNRYANANISSQLPIVHWSAFFYLGHFSVEQAQVMMKSWKLSNKEIDSVVKLLAILYAKDKETWSTLLLFDIGYKLNDLGEQLYCQLHNNVTPLNIDELYEQLPIKQMSDLAVNGHDIIQALKKERGGAYLGHIIQQLKEAVIFGHLKNEKNTLLDWVVTQYSENEVS